MSHINYQKQKIFNLIDIVGTNYPEYHRWLRGDLINSKFIEFLEGVIVIISKSVFVALVLMCEVNHKTKYANKCSVDHGGIYKTMDECKRATNYERCVEFSSGEYQLYYDGPKSYTDAMERGRK